MAFLLRTSLRAPRTRILTATYSTSARRFAGDYGSVQSGHEQGVSEKNPMKHLEHPGPESPAAKSQSSATAGSPDESKKDAEPKINQPKSAAEDQNEDVRKHNEEMANRAEKSANQLSEEDNKVDKKFWKGDVGDIDKSKA